MSKDRFIKNTIIDQCFAPLLQEFYIQDFKQGDFDSLSKQLMDSSSSKKHEAVVGIYQLFSAHNELIKKIVKSGILFKLVVYLKDEQFPQLSFEALRVLFLAVEHRRAAEYLVSCGGVYSLLNIVHKQIDNVLIGVSLWTLIKITHQVSGLDLDLPQDLDVNDFISLAQDPTKLIQTNSVIASLIANLWKKNVFLRPEDINQFRERILIQLLSVNIKEEALIISCFKLLHHSPFNYMQVLASKNWRLLKQVLANLEGKQTYILRPYLKFLLTIQKNQESFIFKEILISHDVFRIFQGILNDQDEKSQLRFCILVQKIIQSRIFLALKYFLGKTSILIRFYSLIESSSLRVRKMICYIFASLSDFNSEDVLLLYEEAKIAAVYFRLLKQATEHEFIEICLYSLIRVLSFAQKMSLTTYNWFLNHLKTEKVEETINKIEESLPEDDKIRPLLPQLRVFFSEKEVEA